MKKPIKNLFSIILSIVSIMSSLLAQNRWEGFGLTFQRPITCFYSDTTENVLYVGGEFRTVNGIQAQGIIKLDLFGFDTLGLGVGTGSTPFVKNIIKYNNEIYVCGSFLKSGNIQLNSIAKWNGSNWDSLQSGIIDTTGGVTQGLVSSMVIFNNELCVGGGFTHAGGIHANNIAKWNGSNWSDIFGFPGYELTDNDFYLIHCMASYNNELYVGGSIIDSSGMKKNGIMRWTGVKWELVGGGITGDQSDVYCMAVYKNELYVGGCFNKAEGNIGNGIQKWNGQVWKEVGNGVTLTNYFYSAVKNMYVYNDQLIITGDFDKAGSIPARTIASWDGSKWCSINDSIVWQVSAFSEYHDTLIMGGWFMINNDTNLIALVKYLEPTFSDTCSQAYLVPYSDYEDSIKIFPNPAHSELTIISNNGEPIKHAEIFSLTSKMILCKDFNASDAEIVVSGLAEGLYLLKVKTTKETVVKKLVIVR